MPNYFYTIYYNIIPLNGLNIKLFIIFEVF